MNDTYQSKMDAAAKARSEKLAAVPRNLSREEFIKATDAIFAEYHAAVFDAIESAKITQRQLERILVSEGVIQAAALADPEGYDGGKMELAMTLATQQINERLITRDDLTKTETGVS